MFGQFVDYTQEYFTSTFESLKNINNELLYGGVILVTKDRKYTEGEIKGTTSNNVIIFGYPVDLQSKVDDLCDKAKEDVDNDKCPALYKIQDLNFKNSDIRDLKRKIKEKIDTKRGEYVAKLKQSVDASIKNELKLVNLIDKINYVAGERDGYKNNQNKPIIYELSGSSMTEYKQDVDKMILEYGKYNDELNKGLIPPGSTYEFNENYDFVIPVLGYETTEDIPYDNKFFMIFGKEILDNCDKFAEELYEVVKESNDAGRLETYLKTVICRDLGAASSTIFVGTPPKSLFEKYKKQNDTYKNDVFASIENGEFYQKVKTNYQSELKNKERKVLYAKQDPLNQTDGDNLVKLYQSVSVPDNEFNFKKEFRG